MTQQDKHRYDILVDAYEAYYRDSVHEFFDAIDRLAKVEHRKFGVVLCDVVEAL